MKKNIFLLVAVCGTVAFAGCKSSANAYQQAYEKAIQNDEPAVVQTQPAVQSAQPAQSEENIQVRQEKVTAVNESDAIQAYAVVCGSFSLKANADALKQSLEKDGYKPVVAINEAGKTYRVILASFPTKEEAAAARNDFKKKYPDNQDFQGSWLLYNK